MASFAKIGLNSKVIEVLSVHDNVLKDANDVEQEVNGIDFLTKLTGWAIWKQTSYNTLAGQHKLGGTPFRKNYAGIGYTYDEDRDAFVSPKPYASWVLNEESCLWEAPTAKPETYTQNLFIENKDGTVTNTPRPDIYKWNEETQQWDLNE
jgi:hypothetical protein